MAPPSPPPPPQPPHLSTLGDPRVPLARMAAAGAALVALAVGLVVFGGGEDAPETEPAAPAADAPASLWVNADPTGSTVFVDGDSVGAVPLWLDRVADGQRRIRIVSPGGRTLTDTTLWVQTGQVADLDLAPADGLVVTASTDVPEGAETIAAAPDRADRPRRDDRPERADRPERPPRAERPAPARAATPTTGELRVSSAPVGATVLLDGRRIGRTPLTLGGVRPGRHVVTVERQGFETTAREVTIRPGGVFEAAIDLRPTEAMAQAPPAATGRTEPGRAEPTRPAPARPAPAPPAAPVTGVVEILVRPWGSIAIDGETVHEATDVVYRAELAVGTHRVVVANPSFGSDERTVTVRPGGRSRIEFNLAGADGR